MGISYDEFTDVFLQKVTELDFPDSPYEANKLVDGYMKRALGMFHKVCPYDFVSTRDDNIREFDLTVEVGVLTEIVDIVTEGMLEQWLKPYLFRQENLETVLNTKDYSSYSPAELLYRIKDTYQMAKRDFKNRTYEYSYDHGDLTELNL